MNLRPREAGEATHPRTPPPYVLVHHVLNPLLYLGEGGGLTAVVEHGDHRLHAPEHLSQHLVLVRQRETGARRLGEAVVALVRRRFSAKRNKETGVERATSRA